MNTILHRCREDLFIELLLQDDLRRELLAFAESGARDVQSTMALVSVLAAKCAATEKQVREAVGHLRREQCPAARTLLSDLMRHPAMPRDISDPWIEMRRCVQALAQPAAVQVALFPHFVVAGDELALDFEEAMRRIDLNALSEPEREVLTMLERTLDAHSGPANVDFWLDRSRLFTDQGWAALREHAAAVLATFGWPNEKPARSGAIYVS